MQKREGGGTLYKAGYCLGLQPKQATKERRKNAERPANQRGNSPKQKANESNTSRKGHYNKDESNMSLARKALEQCSTITLECLYHSNLADVDIKTLLEILSTRTDRYKGQRQEAMKLPITSKKGNK